MTCNECFEAFSSALDGELDPQEQNDMTEHLEACADCRHLQTRMLALSAELKAQPFPQPTAESLQKLSQEVLAGAQTVRWTWLRRALRLPYESWPLRTALRLLSFGTVLFFVFQIVLTQRIRPFYTGVEAVSKAGFAGSLPWMDWSPGPQLMNLAAVIALLLGLWTCGLPELLWDLASATRLTKRDLIRLGVGSLLLGPIFASPFLAALEFGIYLVVCCLWAGLCLLITYLFVAFKTQRPLPRLAIDFVSLTVLLGILEWIARKSLGTPEAATVNKSLELLVGHLGFSDLLTGLGLLTLAFLFGSVGLSGLVRPYRSAGGKPVAGLLVILAMVCLVPGLKVMSFQAPLVATGLDSESRRKVYLLGSSKEQPWKLSEIDYPALELELEGAPESPEIARAKLAAAFLEWNDTAYLEALTAWADKAPGVIWGLTSATDSLGIRQGNVLAVATEQRRRSVAQLLKTTTWRRLQDVVLSEESGSVSGRLQDQDGAPLIVPLRLLKLDGENKIGDLVKGLEAEPNLVKNALSSEQSVLGFALPSQRSLQTDHEGRFSFTRVPDGRYLLAMLAAKPAPLTLNSSIPGVFVIEKGRKLELEPIRLTLGQEGTSIDLSAERWQPQGGVSFSGTSELETAKLDAGASITGFVDSRVFAGGKARVKILILGADSAEGTIQARFFSKSGQLLKVEKGTLLARAQVNELEIDSGQEEGYLQLTLSSKSGQFTVQTIKVEVLSGG